MAAAELAALAPGQWETRTRALALAVLRDDATFTVDDPRFSTAVVVGPSMLSTDGAEHERHRRPFARAYRLDAVRADHAEQVRADCDTLIDGFADAGEAELRRQLAGPLAVLTMARALGLDALPVATVLGWYDAIVSAVTVVSGGDDVPEAGRTAFAGLADHLRPALAAHGDLTPDEAVSNAAVLLFGGVETTEGMIANAALHLLGHPAQRALVAADRSLLPGAVNESLRLEPAAPFVDRYATADVEVAGEPVRRGDLVRVSLGTPTAIPPRSPIPSGSTCAGRRPACSWRSRRGLTSASACTWRGWRRPRRSTACSTGCPASSSTRRAPPWWQGRCSASRRRCGSSSDGRRRVTVLCGSVRPAFQGQTP